MDRTLIYAGQIPLETDLLSTNKNTMVSIAKLVAGLFGTSTFANGLSCGATGPASLQVVVQPGEVYALANIDDTAYSSIAADTTHQIMKQGILLDALTLNCPAPGTAGQSINYLIQVQMTEVDTTPVALPYYNASNPASAWVGPANSGAQQYTFRQDKAAVTVKAGVAATTGSQVTPAPDASNVGLFVVTVANGQSTITSANIAQYVGAPLQALGGAISSIHNGYYSKNVAGNTNVTLTPQEAAYPIINLTGALTGNINLIIPATSNQLIIANNTTGSFTVTVKTPAGTGVVVTQGLANVLYCDGVNVNSATPNTAAATTNPVPVRQTILKAAAAPLQIGTGLAVNLLATTTPYIVAIPAGMGANGQIDYITRRIADVTGYWSGLSASTTNYLFVDRNVSTGVDSGVSSTLPYIAQLSTVAASTVNGQHTYMTDTGEMYVGNGSTASVVQRTAVGECVTGASTVTSVTPYAPLGQYESSEQSVTLGTSYSVNSNIGITPKWFSVVLRNKTSELGYAVGEEASIFSSGATNGNLTLPIGSVTRNNLGVVLGNSAGITAVTSKSTFNVSAITLANWRLVLRAQRGF